MAVDNTNTRRKSEEDGRKKRVGKACDSCRMKKTKVCGYIHRSIDRSLIYEQNAN